MKKKFVYVLFACLAMVNMALGQQNESRLALNPEVPVAGKSLELTYNPQGGPLEGKSDLVGVVYSIIFITGRWVCTIKTGRRSLERDFRDAGKLCFYRF